MVCVCAQKSPSFCIMVRTHIDLFTAHSLHFRRNDQETLRNRYVESKYSRDEYNSMRILYAEICIIGSSRIVKGFFSIGTTIYRHVMRLHAMPISLHIIRMES